METNSFTPRLLHLQENSRQHLVIRTTSELQGMSKHFRVKKNLLHVPGIEYDSLFVHPVV